MGMVARRYALSERQMRAVSTSALARLAPSLTRRLGTSWWAWIDVSGTLWPRLPASDRAAATGHRPLGVQLSGATWMPATEAMRLAASFSHFSDGIVLLGDEPSDDCLSAKVVLEASCASVWFLYTHDADAVLAALGQEMESEELSVGDTDDLGTGGSWHMVVTDDGFELTRCAA